MQQSSADKAIQASIAFLRRWQRGGPWVISALDPDKGFIRTAGFGPGDEDPLAKFLREWRPRRNLYFQVNRDLRVPGEIVKKGRKDHIGDVLALQADVDAYKDGEDLDEGRARVMRMLTDELPAGIPGPPSVINLSGNGYNCFWRLRTPIAVNGDLSLVEGIERHNRGLQVAFGGDATTDINRIMRLPWSINFPNPKKRALGLTPVLAKQVTFDTGLRYDLDQFPAVERTDAPSRNKDRAARIADNYVISAAARRVADIDQLLVSERTKTIIEVGSFPGEARESRSEWLFTVILSMIRCGEPDEIILGVITDPQWGISASILEKPNPEQEARRQIGHAHGWLTTQMEFDDE